MCIICLFVPRSQKYFLRGTDKVYIWRITYINNLFLYFLKCNKIPNLTPFDLVETYRRFGEPSASILRIKDGRERIVRGGQTRIMFRGWRGIMALAFCCGPTLTPTFLTFVLCRRRQQALRNVGTFLPGGMESHPFHILCYSPSWLTAITDLAWSLLHQCLKANRKCELRSENVLQTARPAQDIPSLTLYCPVVTTFTRFNILIICVLPVSVSFPSQHHSPNAPRSSSSTRCSYQKDKLAKLGSLQKATLFRRSGIVG